MSEIIDLKDMLQIILWTDSDTAYEVRSCTLIKGAHPTIKAILKRIKPFPHLIDDEWTFNTSTNADGTINVNLDFYTQNQPDEDED